MDEVWIDQHRVVVADGQKSQTVNVCRNGDRGDYKEVYRSSQPSNWVKTGALQQIQTLYELAEYLIKRGFVAEGGRA